MFWSTSVVPVAGMASVEPDRGGRFFLSPGGVRAGPLRVGEASQRLREVSRRLCSGHIALGQRPAGSPPHPAIVQPGLRTVDPILDSAQPPAAPQRPQLPASLKIGAARDPQKPLP